MVRSRWGQALRFGSDRSLLLIWRREKPNRSVEELPTSLEIKALTSAKLSIALQPASMFRKVTLFRLYCTAMQALETISRSARMKLIAAWFVAMLCSLAESAEPQITSVTRIWDQAEHSAFTDLTRFENRWWCTFREAKDHGPSIGKVRVISSEDGEQWTSSALLEQHGVDLRDPKLSIMPDGRLMLIMGGSVYSAGGRYGTRAPRVSFSKHGWDWTAPKKLLAEDHWLWRVTWQGEWGWSVSKLGEGRDPRRGMLYRTRDGMEWEWITEFRLPDNTWNASETTLRFMPDGEMIALVRPHWIGASKPPYTAWSWTKMKENIGGPNFIRLPDGQLWASGRHYGDQATTVLARMTRDSYDPVLTLPSGGDCSYPGMAWHDGLLWMSYYSSHEGKASIYLAKIRIPDDGERDSPPKDDANTACTTRSPSRIDAVRFRFNKTGDGIELLRPSDRAQQGSRDPPPDGSFEVGRNSR